MEIGNEKMLGAKLEILCWIDKVHFSQWKVTVPTGAT